MLRREDPEFVPPNPENSRLQLNGASSSNVEKRGREDDEDMADGTRQLKREKAGGDEDGEEMDMEDDDDSPDKKQGSLDGERASKPRAYPHSTRSYRGATYSETIMYESSSRGY